MRMRAVCAFTSIWEYRESEIAQWNNIHSYVIRVIHIEGNIILDMWEYLFVPIVSIDDLGS